MGKEKRSNKVIQGKILKPFVNKIPSFIPKEHHKELIQRKETVRDPIIESDARLIKNSTA